MGVCNNTGSKVVIGNQFEEIIEYCGYEEFTPELSKTDFMNRNKRQGQSMFNNPGGSSVGQRDNPNNQISEIMDKEKPDTSGKEMNITIPNMKEKENIQLRSINTRNKTEGEKGTIQIQNEEKISKIEQKEKNNTNFFEKEIENKIIESQEVNISNQEKIEKKEEINNKEYKKEENNKNEIQTKINNILSNENNNANKSKENIVSNENKPMEIINENNSQKNNNKNDVDIICKRNNQNVQFKNEIEEIKEDIVLNEKNQEKDNKIKDSENCNNHCKTVENSSKIIKLPDIKTIVSEKLLEEGEGNEVLFISFLKKIVHISIKERVKYAERLCLVTKDNFIIYNTKEDYIKLKTPLVIIPIYSILKIVLFKLTKKVLNYDHFYIEFKLGEMTNNNIYEKISTFFINDKKENLNIKNNDTALVMFNTDEKMLAKKWYVLLTYLINLKKNVNNKN